MNRKVIGVGLFYCLSIILINVLVHILGGVFLQGTNDSSILLIVNLSVIGFMVIVPLLFLMKLRLYISLNYIKKLLFLILGLTVNFLSILILNVVDLFDRINSHDEFVNGFLGCLLLNFLVLLPVTSPLLLCIKNKKPQISQIHTDNNP